MIAQKTTRLPELIQRLLVNRSVSDDELRRLLFACDFTAFARLGNSISGVEYIRTANGPEPLGFDDAKSAATTIAGLSGDEEAIVEAVLAGKYRDSCRAWELAEEGELIPYEIALVGDRAPTPEEKRYGIELQSVAAESIAHDGGA